MIKIAVPDGEKTLNAIDSTAASGAKGFVICTPDPKLGPAIMAKARGYDMKVIAVDDQFANAKGKPMDTVPLVMMAATKIGERQARSCTRRCKTRLGCEIHRRNGHYRQRTGYRTSSYFWFNGSA